MKRVPGLMRTPSDDPDAISQIRRQMGAPENADGYKTPEIDGKGLEIDYTMANTFKGWAAKYGLTQEQYQGIIKDFSDMSINQALEQRSINDADTLALSGEWGAAYDQRMTMIKNFAERTGAPPALVQALRSGNAGNTTSRWLYKLVESLGGEASELTRISQDRRIMSPSDADTKIKEIMGNKQHPYYLDPIFLIVHIFY